MRHRFINDGVSPIPMGASAEFCCVCGRRGSRDFIEQHIVEANVSAERAPQEDFSGGDTKAHYAPHEPRKPAPTGQSVPLQRPDRAPTPEPLPPPPSTKVASAGIGGGRVPRPDCPTCDRGEQVADLPEISAWSCGHWIRKHPGSIAESFQAMLRIAYRAGAASAATGEVFETWYQREVLQ